MTLLPRAEIEHRVERFLTEIMPSALRAVEFREPRFDDEPSRATLAEAALGKVMMRHLSGAPDAVYFVEAFGDALLMSLQLNVHRLVLLYRVPAIGALDASTLSARLERWAIGARHAGWVIGWRDTPNPHAPLQRYVEIYCYAMAAPELLENDGAQLFWLTDMLQMTRALFLEAKRFEIALSPRAAGFSL